MLITSRKNATVREYRELMRDKRTRHNAGEFVVEGDNLCREAIRSGLSPNGAVFTKTASEKYGDLYNNLLGRCPVVVISDEIGEYISDTKSPQGLFLKLPFLDKIENIDKIVVDSKNVVLLDDLQDSGNLGAIIRTAEALGIDAVLVSTGSCDIYSPKVVRAAAGSSLRLPIVVADLEKMLVRLKEIGYNIFAAMPSAEATTLGKSVFGGKNAVVIGNEGNGVSEKIVRLCDKSIYIPIKNAESLNASIAAAILMWEMANTNI